MIKTSKLDPSRQTSGADTQRRTFIGAVGAFGLAAAGSLAWPQSARAESGKALQAVLDAAVAAQDVPFAVAIVADRDGILWSGASGESSRGVAATDKTMMRIFSMTKAIGATAAMMMVDRDRLSLDTPVQEILPEFADLKVLEGFDGDKPILRKPKLPATIRHLATHTSGLAYEVWNPDVGKYLQVTKHPSVLSGTRESLNYPLAFDPGERWDYGPGIDWLGLVVEKLDGRRIDQFCQEEIFAPLKMTDTVFELDEARMSRLATNYGRGEDGRFAPFDLMPPPSPEVYGMGHALYSTPADYMRFVRAMLGAGELEGARVLSRAAMQQMLANQIGHLTIPEMVSLAPPISANVNLFPGTPKTHSIGFLRTEEDVPGMRAAGSQGWAGICNTHYWFDPSNGVGAVLMTQSLPFVEPGLVKTYTAFEKAVYAGQG